MKTHLLTTCYQKSSCKKCELKSNYGMMRKGFCWWLRKYVFQNTEKYEQYSVILIITVWNSYWWWWWCMTRWMTRKLCSLSNHLTRYHLKTHFMSNRQCWSLERCKKWWTSCVVLIQDKIYPYMYSSFNIWSYSTTFNIIEFSVQNR